MDEPPIKFRNRRGPPQLIGAQGPLDLNPALLIAIILLSLIYLTNVLLLKPNWFILDHPNLGLLLILMLSKFQVACHEISDSGLALNLPLIFNVSVLLQINTMLLSSTKPNVFSICLYYVFKSFYSPRQLWRTVLLLINFFIMGLFMLFLTLLILHLQLTHLPVFLI